MIFGAIVVLLILVALAVLLIPLFKQPGNEETVDREQQNIQIAKEKKAQLDEQLSEGQMSDDEYRKALDDLEKALAIDLEKHQKLQVRADKGRWAAWVFVLLVPLASILVYAQLGSWQVIENPELAAVPTAQPAHAEMSMEQMLDKLKSHLRDNPEDVQGWFILGRTMMQLQQYPQAVTAFQRSYDLSPDQSVIVFSLADALAMANDGDMRGEPEALVKKGLQLAPGDITGLWLAGLAAEQDGRIAEAFDYFNELLPKLEDDPASTQELLAMLQDLKARDPQLPEINQPLPSIESGITVSVSLDPALAEQTKADELLFIYAKAAQGPPMPLAAKRMTVADLPVTLTLRDADAMMAQMKLSMFDEIIVGARVSKTGNPIAEAGDFFAESGVISQQAFEGKVDLTIDQVR